MYETTEAIKTGRERKKQRKKERKKNCTFGSPRLAWLDRLVQFRSSSAGVNRLAPASEHRGDLEGIRWPRPARQMITQSALIVGIVHGVESVFFFLFDRRASAKPPPGASPPLANQAAWCGCSGIPPRPPPLDGLCEQKSSTLSRPSWRPMQPNRSSFIKRRCHPQRENPVCE